MSHITIRESVEELEEYSMQHGSKAVLKRLAVLQLYKLLRQKGDENPLPSVCLAVGVKETTAEKWLEVYAESGIDAVLAFGRRAAKPPSKSPEKPRGRGAPSRAPVKDSVAPAAVLLDEATEESALSIPHPDARDGIESKMKHAAPDTHESTPLGSSTKSSADHSDQASGDADVIEDTAFTAESQPVESIRNSPVTSLAEEPPMPDVYGAGTVASEPARAGQNAMARLVRRWVPRRSGRADNEMAGSSQPEDKKKATTLPEAHSGLESAESAQASTPRDEPSNLPISPASGDAEKSNRPRRRSLDGARVLIADTDEMIRAIVRHRLEKHGATVVSACDGMEAVSLSLNNHFDFFVVTVALPGLDGFEFTRWIREHREDGFTPVLVLSWPGNESDLVRAFDAGADDFLLKPFSPVELVARMKRLLSRSTTDPDLGSYHDS